MNRRLADWPGVLDTHLAIGDRQVRVLRSRRRRGGKAEPHLLLHGLGGSSATWVEVMEGLSEHGPVVAVDLPGFGGTAPSPDDSLTISGYVEFVGRVADALGWERFSLHGNSMGGLVAALVAARLPERVDRLVLVSPAIPPRSPLSLLLPHRPAMDAFLPIALSSLTATSLGLVGVAGPELGRRRNRDFLKLIYPDPDTVDRRLLRLMAADLADPRIDAHERRRAFLSALGSIARSWTDPRRTWRAISRVEAPTLVIGGTRDALVPARTLRALLAHRPDWEGHVLDDRRHALMLEDPQGYLDLVSQWRAGARRAA
jgi:pimeloyl-ACP methyl ester carboxylesterase